MVAFALVVCALSVSRISISGLKHLRQAKRRAQNLVSYLYYFRFCYLEGGSLDGGDLVSPRCLGPSRLTPEGCGAAHRPRHPAYLLLLGFRFYVLVLAYVPLGFWVRCYICLLGSKKSLFACVALQVTVPTGFGFLGRSSSSLVCFLGVRVASSRRLLRTTRPTG